MKQEKISERALEILKQMQRNEITEHYIYADIAKRQKSGENREVLEKIAAEELAHHDIWKKYTGRDAKPNRIKIIWIGLLSRILGFTFAVKYMENGEDAAGDKYKEVEGELPEIRKVIEEENMHEQSLIELLDEERLRYVGSMVLGLNDALVELTGTLAGLTFALQNTRLIALSGLITGISATLSMASSEYLSSKSEGNEDALKSCVYTGIAYMITVALLVLPYLIFPQSSYLLALVTMIVIVIVIILFFNYYISVARSLPFKKRFLEMAAISLSVAVISFAIGLLVKRWLGIDV